MSRSQTDIPPKHVDPSHKSNCNSDCARVSVARLTDCNVASRARDTPRLVWSAILALLLASSSCVTPSRQFEVGAFDFAPVLDIKPNPDCPIDGQGAEWPEAERALADSLRNSYGEVSVLLTHDASSQSVFNLLTKQHVRALSSSSLPDRQSTAFAFVGTVRGYIVILHNSSESSYFCIDVRRTKSSIRLVPVSLGSSMLGRD